MALKEIEVVVPHLKTTMLRTMVPHLETTTHLAIKAVVPLSETRTLQKKGLGARIAAFAAKHGEQADVAADQVLKKNADNDEQPDVAAAQVKKKQKKDQVC